MPRSSWDEDPRFLDTFPENVREGIRTVVSVANFSPDTEYVVVRHIRHIKHSVPQSMDNVVLFYAKGALRGVELVDALTSAATTPKDLAAAIAWCNRQLSTNNPIMDHLERQAAAHGPPRALHDQVAYYMMQSMPLSLEFCVRLVGLRGATHLNGRAGVIRGFDSTNLNRFCVRLDDDDGKEVSVKAENIEHIRGDDYRRRAP
jgi:hypothetical protein